MSKVSIIVPVYKVEEYLVECLDSIKNQSFEDIQVILVDDGSPDKCPEICDSYAKNDNRFVVIHKENQGPGSARNTGLDWFYSNSDSKYIAFVDSDDVVGKDFIKVLYKCAEQTAADMSQITLTRCYQKLDTGKTNCKLLKPGDFFNLKYKIEFETVVYIKLYRRELLQTIRFNKGIIGEDVVFSFLTLFKSATVAVSDRILYFYRTRQTSLTMTDTNLTNLENISAYRERALSTIESGHTEASNYFFKTYFWEIKNKLAKLYNLQSLNPSFTPPHCDIQSLIKKLENTLDEDLMMYGESAHFSKADIFEITEYKPDSKISKIKRLFYMVIYDGPVKTVLTIRRLLRDRKTGKYYTK